MKFTLTQEQINKLIQEKELELYNDARAEYFSNRLKKLLKQADKEKFRCPHVINHVINYVSFYKVI